MTRSPFRSSEDGFTLVELLVVILILGIVAAIAVPAFLNQRTKSQDAETKVYLVATQKALEIWHTEHDSYEGADVAALARIEPALLRLRNPDLSVEENTFSVSADSAATAGGKRFTLARVSRSEISRTCENPGKGACPGDGSW